MLMVRYVKPDDFRVKRSGKQKLSPAYYQTLGKQHKKLVDWTRLEPYLQKVKSTVGNAAFGLLFSGQQHCGVRRIQSHFVAFYRNALPRVIVLHSSAICKDAIGGEGFGTGWSLQGH